MQFGHCSNRCCSAFRFSKKYFWLGEEAVPTQSLSHYLRGEKAEVAHPTAAWSSQTGKGLLYFVKHADEKATPAGVLNLVRTDFARLVPPHLLTRTTGRCGEHHQGWHRRFPLQAPWPEAHLRGADPSRAQRMVRRHRASRQGCQG